MAYKTYIVDGRQFRTESDYRDAMHDKEIIDSLRKNSAGFTTVQLTKLLERVERGEFHFRTLLGQDLEDELRERIRRAGRNPGSAGKRAEPSVRDKKEGGAPEQEKAIQEAVRQELEKRERRRKILLLLSGLAAVLCLGIFGVYAYQGQRNRRQNEKLGELIRSETQPVKRPSQQESTSVSVNLDGEKEIPEVLEEYKTIYNQHKKLIGWLKFDDKDIGGEYGMPVMQTGDNEFFLSHDIELNSDKNGTIFMDTNCDVLKPSTNFILYGHHMKSGAMFGNLDHYAKEEYWKKYPYVEFDTIYEKGTYQIMYVFRSRVYSEGEIVFKYYQFTEALSDREFDSYMEEMAEMSLYNTGVTAEFGDQILTLSTCDYQEADGRFVVVAKKVTARE